MMKKRWTNHSTSQGDEVEQETTLHEGASVALWLSVSARILEQKRGEEVMASG